MGKRRWFSIAVLVFFALMALPLHASRADIINPEVLLMPGKLSKAHQKFEDHCALCHDLRDRSKQNSLCLACHKKVAADIRARHGLHGHIPAITTSKCSACHMEHLGRNADILGLDPALFDHDLTGFALRGAHAGLPCVDCHEPGKAYRDAPRQCSGCHERDDPHGGQLGPNCAKCHVTDSWWDTHFNHATTGFPLRGAHARLACAQCHIANRYKDTPRRCVSCHATDDVHHGGRGENCAACHTARGWAIARFNHLEKTGFALRGAHARLRCADCHRGGHFKVKLPTSCVGCHRGQDPHAGRLGSDCARCHDSVAWQPANFDHALDAHWALLGAHAKLDCFACHSASVSTQKLSTSCVSCHKVDDVHRGALGTDCAKCHTTTQWSNALRFDHDQTSFPLKGLHVAVPCAQCHLTTDFHDTPRRCVDCHRANDVHKGAFGSNCARCHSPAGWRLWSFNHATQTDFPLTGAHAALPCAACHKPGLTRVRLSTNCAACHMPDDVHLGRFGTHCERCHSTRTFADAKVH